MWIKASSEITENTSQITNAVSSHILAQGNRTCLFDASISAMGEDLCEGINTITNNLDYVFLSKTSFNTLGAIPYLREKFPDLELVGGKESNDLLNEDQVIEDIITKNRLASEALGKDLNYTKDQFKEALKIDVILTDGETLDLGAGVDLKLISTSGSTSDSVSYYIKSDYMLYVGGAIGVYGGRGLVTPNFTHSLKDYLQSINKLSAFDVKYLGFSHNGTLSGDLVSDYFREILVSANNYKDLFKNRLSSGESIEDIAKSVQIEWSVEGRYPEGPFKDMMLESIKKMILLSK